MKIYALIISTILYGASLTAFGQDAAPPSVDLYEEQNLLEPTPSPEPPNGPDLPEISQLDQNFSKPRSLGPQADALRVHKEWRQLKNRTVNDPEVQAAKAYAQSARTDLEKRTRLRNYYDVYYQRMNISQRRVNFFITPSLQYSISIRRNFTWSNGVME